MKNIPSLKRKIFSSIIAGVLACSFFLNPISQTLHLYMAEAAAVTVVGDTTPQSWGTWLEGKVTALSTVATSISSGSLVTKEYILDNIAWPLANIILQQMIRDTTRWVNSGFKGSPAFVSNLGEFMKNAADQVAGNLIWNGGLDALCSPFKLNIQLALDIQYSKTRGTYKAQCTLSKASKNIESFFKGDFVSTNWNDWYNITMRPENNPYGAMLQAQTGLSMEISNTQGRNLNMLSFGRGFLTREECTGVGSKERCHTVTPGSVIEGQLNSSLAGSQRRIEVADELNELIGALFSQLVSNVLGGAGGLLGMSSSKGGGDYFDAISKEKAPTMYTGAETANPFPNVISTQKTYLELQNEIINLITDAASYKDTVYGSSCGASGALTSSLSSKLNTATTSKASVTKLINTLTVFNTDYTLLRSTTTPAATIATLLVTYNAKNVLEAQSNLMSQYSTYTISGALHTNEENVRIQLSTIPDLKTEISNFKARIDMQCRL